MTSTLSVVKSLKDLTDRDLVIGLKSVEEHAYLNRYQTEFYRRFAPYILKIALQSCQTYPGGEALARDLTQQTFICAFSAIDKFTIVVGEDAIFKKLVKAWLGKIANRHFLKLYAQRKNEDANTEWTEAEEPSYEMIETLDPKVEEQPSEYIRLLREAMNQLKEIDQHIVNSYAGEGCLESTRHISDRAMHLLCETYQTTSENIRKRKNRALKKIREYCSKHSIRENKS